MKFDVLVAITRREEMKMAGFKPEPASPAANESVTWTEAFNTVLDEVRTGREISQLVSNEKNTVLLED